MGTKTVTEESMPDFQEEFLNETVIPYAQDIADKDFVSYDGDFVAGLTPLQEEALAGYGNLDAGSEAYGQASDIYGALGEYQSQDLSAAQIADVDMSSYMSPYTQNVIDSGLSKLGDFQEQELNKQGYQASRAGAFGGSRHGVAEAETRKDYGQQASDLITSQMQEAFINAQDMAAQDIASQNEFALENVLADERAAAIQAGGAEGLVGTAGDQLGYALDVLGSQMEAGGLPQLIEQLGLDAEYQQFLNEQQHPLIGFDALIGAAGGIPQGYGMTTQETSGLGPTLAAGGSMGMGWGGLYGGGV